jgi:hypothetical protein
MVRLFSNQFEKKTSSILLNPSYVKSSLQHMLNLCTQVCTSRNNVYTAFVGRASNQGEETC